MLVVQKCFTKLRGQFEESARGKATRAYGAKRAFIVAKRFTHMEVYLFVRGVHIQ